MTWQCRRGFMILGTILTLLPGCLSFVNPTPEPPKEQKALCRQLPPPACHSVYVVLVNGVDPMQCGNLQGVRNYLGRLGFVKTYYAQLYHEYCLINELREVRQSHPDARFVIVGFEYGAIPARELARRCHDQGLPVDLLVYLQPKGVHRGTASSQRVLTIETGAHDLNEPQAGDGETIRVPCLTRYGVPTNGNTLSILANELFQLASGIRVDGPLDEPPPTLLEEPAPPPRPVVIQPQKIVDEWDFLKPVSRKRNAASPPASEPDVIPVPSVNGKGDKNKT